MQMLDAAGVPCLGEWPAFEPVETAIGFKWRELLPLVPPGTAAKIVDYHLCSKPIPSDLRARIIVTNRRNRLEAAKSAHKLVANMFAGPIAERPTKGQLKTIAHGFKVAHRRYYMNIAQWAPESAVMHQSFEHLIREPRSAADSLARFIGPHGGFDIDSMVACVRPRGPECYEGLIKLELLKEKRGEK